MNVPHYYIIHILGVLATGVIVRKHVDVDLSIVLGCGLDSSNSEYSPVVGCCNCSHESSGSINDRNFFTSQLTVSFRRRALLFGVM
jgi:hypothetical protein